MNDLDYHNSPFRESIKSLEDCIKLREVIEWVLTEHGTLNRPLLTRFIGQLLARKQQFYLKIVNLAYYLGGLNAIPPLKLHCRQTYLGLIRRKISYDALHLKQAGVQFFTKAAFQTFLKLHNLNLIDLGILDVDSLKEIRKSNVTRKFRAELFRLINNWSEGKISEDNILNLEMLELDLAQTIRSELDREYKRLCTLKRMEAIHTGFRIAGTTISGLSSLFSLLQTNYVTGIISIATGGILLASGPILNLLIKNKSNFIAFGELLKKKIHPAS
jgi:hypothetical protein